MLAVRNVEPHAIVRWDTRVYVQIFTSHYVLNGEEFELLHDMFPNAVFMTDVVQVRWKRGADHEQL